MKQRISFGWFTVGVLTILSFVLSSYTQGTTETEEDTFTFSDKNLVDWNDYQPRVGVVSVYKALTYTGIKYKLDTDDDQRVSLEITAYFDKSRSWVNKESMTEELLNHEQRHFDITAIYAEQLRNELKSFVGMNIAKFMDTGKSKKVKETFNRVYAEMEAKQRAYDTATGHSTNVESQVKWDEWIDTEFDSLGLTKSEKK